MAKVQQWQKRSSDDDMPDTIAFDVIGDFLMNVAKFNLAR
jgi:hypothetical protein